MKMAVNNVAQRVTMNALLTAASEASAAQGAADICVHKYRNMESL